MTDVTGYMLEDLEIFYNTYFDFIDYDSVYGAQWVILDSFLQDVFDIVVNISWRTIYLGGRALYV